MTQVIFEKRWNDVLPPVYKHDDDSGADVRAYLYNDYLNRPNNHEYIAAQSTQIFNTGLIIKHITPGYEIQVRSRSGLAAKEGIFVLNSPGTIDAGYRGEITIILHNTADCDYKISHGDRIAQIVMQKVERMTFSEDNSYESITKRGNGKFGSTGMRA